MNTNPIPTYTNQMLVENFNNIAEGLHWASAGINEMASRVVHAENEVAQLARQVAKLSTKTSRRPGKLALLMLVAGSVYVGYKYAEMEFEGRVARPADLADKVAANAVKDDKTN